MSAEKWGGWAMGCAPPNKGATRAAAQRLFSRETSSRGMRRYRRKFWIVWFGAEGNKEEESSSQEHRRVNDSGHHFRNCPARKQSISIVAGAVEQCERRLKFRLLQIAFGNQTVSRGVKLIAPNATARPPRDSRLCVPTSRQVCLYRVQPSCKEQRRRR